MTDDDRAYERLLHEQLRVIRKEYENASAPIIKRLVDLRNRQPPAPMILRVDQIDPAFLKTLTEKSERHG